MSIDFVSGTVLASTYDGLVTYRRDRGCRRSDGGAGSGRVAPRADVTGAARTRSRSAKRSVSRTATSSSPKTSWRPSSACWSGTSTAPVLSARARRRVHLHTTRSRGVRPVPGRRARRGGPNRHVPPRPAGAELPQDPRDAGLRDRARRHADRSRGRTDPRDRSLRDRRRRPGRSRGPERNECSGSGPPTPSPMASRIASRSMAGVDPSEQVAMVERGEADLALDGVPLDLVEELDRRASDQLVEVAVAVDLCYSAQYRDVSLREPGRATGRRVCARTR